MDAARWRREVSVQLAPMRFTRIEGTAVAVDVASAQDAKAALKELRHKKRELKFLRGALIKQQRAMRPKRSKKTKPEKSGFSVFLDDMRWGLSALIDPKPPTPDKPPPPTLAEIERDVRDLDEIVHNIDGCILQLQGKLLTQG
jgi:hypothetical protein